MQIKYNVSKTGDTLISVSKSPKYNGALLQLYEIEILKQIELHRFMLSTDIIKLIQFVRVKAGLSDQSSNQIRQRLFKLQEAGILVLKEDAERMHVHGLRYLGYMYRLGKRGYRVLGFVENDMAEYEKRYAQVITLNLPNEHGHAGTTLMVNTYMKLLQNDHNLQTLPTIEKGNTHPLFKTTFSSNGQPIVIPDYVISYGRTIVAVEVDTGSQRGNYIPSKVKKYEQFLAANLLQKDISFHVVFSINELVVKNVVVRDRSQRIMTVKDKISFDVDWVKYQHVHMYSSPSTAVPLLIYEILTEVAVTNSSIRSLLATRWLTYLSDLLNPNEIKLEEIDESVFYSEKDKGYADIYFSLHPQYNKNHIYFGLYMTPGSSRDYRRLQATSAKIKNLIKQTDRGVQYHLLLLYESQVHLKSDVIKAHFMKDISIKVAHTMDKALNDSKRFKKVYELEQLPIYDLRVFALSNSVENKREVDDDDE